MSALITIMVRDDGAGRIVLGRDTITLDQTKAEENVVKVLSHLIDSANRNLFNGKDAEKEGGARLAAREGRVTSDE